MDSRNGTGGHRIAMLLALLSMVMLVNLPLCAVATNDWDFTSASNKKEVVERARGSAQFALFSDIVPPPSILMASARVGGALLNLTSVKNNVRIAVTELYAH